MKNTTKKNLNDLIAKMNNTDILKLLIEQKAKDDDVIAIVQGVRESLDEQFDKILDNKPIKTCKKKVNKAPEFDYRKILGFCK